MSMDTSASGLLQNSYATSLATFMNKQQQQRSQQSDDADEAGHKEAKREASKNEIKKNNAQAKDVQQTTQKNLDSSKKAVLKESLKKEGAHLALAKEAVFKPTYLGNSSLLSSTQWQNLDGKLKSAINNLRNSQNMDAEPVPGRANFTGARSSVDGSVTNVVQFKLVEAGVKITENFAKTQQQTNNVSKVLNTAMMDFQQNSFDTMYVKTDKIYQQSIQSANQAQSAAFFSIGQVGSSIGQAVFAAGGTKMMSRNGTENLGLDKEIEAFGGVKVVNGAITKDMADKFGNGQLVDALNFYDEMTLRDHVKSGMFEVPEGSPPGTPIPLKAVLDEIKGYTVQYEKGAINTQYEKGAINEKELRTKCREAYDKCFKADLSEQKKNEIVDKAVETAKDVLKIRQEGQFTTPELKEQYGIGVDVNNPIGEHIDPVTGEITKNMLVVDGTEVKVISVGFRKVKDEQNKDILIPAGKVRLIDELPQGVIINTDNRKKIKEGQVLYMVEHPEAFAEMMNVVRDPVAARAEVVKPLLVAKIKAIAEEVATREQAALQEGVPGKDATTAAGKAWRKNKVNAVKAELGLTYGADEKPIISSAQLNFEDTKDRLAREIPDVTVKKEFVDKLNEIYGLHDEQYFNKNDPNSPYNKNKNDPNSPYNVEKMKLAEEILNKQLDRFPDHYVESLGLSELFGESDVVVNDPLLIANERAAIHQDLDAFVEDSLSEGKISYYSQLVTGFDSKLRKLNSIRNLTDDSSTARPALRQSLIGIANSPDYKNIKNYARDHEFLDGKIFTDLGLGRDHLNQSTAGSAVKQAASQRASYASHRMQVLGHTLQASGQALQMNQSLLQAQSQATQALVQQHSSLLQQQQGQVQAIVGAGNAAASNMGQVDQSLSKNLESFLQAVVQAMQSGAAR